MNALTLANMVRNFNKIVDEAILCGELQPGEQVITHGKTDKLYYRKCEIPAGSVGATLVHKYDHVSTCLKGDLILVDQDGVRHAVSAGDVFITKAGTQRAVIALTDVAFMTVHAVDDIDMDHVEETLGCRSMTEYHHLLEAA